MSLEWSTNRTTDMSVEEINQIEAATSLYFTDLLGDRTHSAFQAPNEALQAVVSVRHQIIENEVMIVESDVSVIHIGNQDIVDIAALLMFLTNKNTTDSSFSALDQMLDMDIALDMVSFSNGEASSILTSVEVVTEEDASRYTDSEKTLIIVSAALSFALFALSSILIWVAGGWLALRKQVKVLLHREEELTRMSRQAEDQEIKQKPTEDTDEEAASPDKDDDNTQFTNPSGILGVNPSYGTSGRGGLYGGLGVKMTPGRSPNSDIGSEIFTPMSEATRYSDTDRMPLGITSMRKLLPDQTVSENDDSLYGIKKLEY